MKRRFWIECSLIAVLAMVLTRAWMATRVKPDQTPAIPKSTSLLSHQAEPTEVGDLTGSAHTTAESREAIVETPNRDLKAKLAPAAATLPLVKGDDMTMEEVANALAKWQTNRAGQDPTFLLVHCVAAIKDRTGDYVFVPLANQGPHKLGQNMAGCSRTLKSGGIRQYTVDYDEYPVYKRVNEETGRPRNEPVPIGSNTLSPELIDEVEKFAQDTLHVLAKGK